MRRQWSECVVSTDLPPVPVALVLLGHHTGLLLAVAQLLPGGYHLRAVILTLGTVPDVDMHERCTEKSPNLYNTLMITCTLVAA